MSRRNCRSRILGQFGRLPVIAGGLALIFMGTGCATKTTAGPYTLGAPGGITVSIPGIGVGPADSSGLVPVKVDGVDYTNGTGTGNTNIRHRTTVWVDGNDNGTVDPGEEAVQESSSPPPDSENPVGPDTPVPPEIGPDHVIHVPAPTSGRSLIIKVKVELEYDDGNGQHQDGGFVRKFKRKVPS